jgi:hypothetical protein
MNKRIYDTIQSAELKEANALVATLFPDAPPKNAEELKARLDEHENSVDLLRTLMTNHVTNKPQGWGVTGSDGVKRFHGERGEKAPLTMNEALGANDVSILFRRVISDVLLMPRETPYIGQDLLSKTVRVDSARQVIFPTLGAISAGPVSASGEFPQQDPSFTQNALEIKVQKYGLQLEILTDVIEDSMWDVFGLYVTMCGQALNRLKEENIFTQAITAGHVMFDNASTNPQAWTSGRAQSSGYNTLGAPNGVFNSQDFITLMGGVLSNGYTPDYAVCHPLTWISLAHDPRLQFQYLTRGNMGETVPAPGLDSAAIRKYLPWGSINVVVSPQLPFAFDEQITINGILQPVSNVSSIMAIDSKSSVLVLQREDPGAHEFDDPRRDIHVLRMSERYGVGVLDEGRGIAVAQNIRLDTDHSPVMNLGMAAPI